MILKGGIVQGNVMGKILIIIFLFSCSCMQCRGKDILWTHLMRVYKRLLLALVPNLKYEHVHLTIFSTMQVMLHSSMSI